MKEYSEAKHKWTFEEDLMCCKLFLDYLYYRLSFSLSELTHLAKIKLPQIKSSSLQQKMLNIKYLFDIEPDFNRSFFRGEESLMIMGREHYTRQNEEAFNQAIKEFKKDKRSIHLWTFDDDVLCCKRFFELCDEDKESRIEFAEAVKKISEELPLFPQDLIEERLTIIRKIASNEVIPPDVDLYDLRVYNRLKDAYILALKELKNELEKEYRQLLIEKRKREVE